MITPSAVRIGETVNETGKSVPSFRIRIVSKCSTGSPRRMRPSTMSSSGHRSSGMITLIERPTTSEASYPNIRSAARFHD